MMRNQLWEQIPNLNPQFRFSHTSTLVQGDYLITYGGESYNREMLSDINVLNLKTCSFEDFSLEGDELYQRTEHTACLFDTNKILIFGGFHGNSHILDDISIISVEQTSPLKLKYKKVAPINGEAITRSGHTAHILEDEMMIVFGGFTKSRSDECSNQLWRLDLENFTWELFATTGAKPEARAKHCSAIKNNKLYIFGGISFVEQKFPHCFYVLSLRSLEWQRSEMKEIIGLLSRYGSFSVCFEDNIFILGGLQDSYDSRNEIVTYSFKEDFLTCLEAKGDYSRFYGGTAVAYKSSLIIFGGFDVYHSGKCLSSKIYRLSLNQDYGGNLYEGKACIFPDDIKSLFCSEKFADIYFLVEGSKVPAHKLVLCLRCQYFANLFTSKMKESLLTEIEIKDVKLQTFKALLGFLYQNEVELTESLAIDLYEVSDKYTQKELASLCEEFLSKNLTLDNFLSIIDFTEKFGTTALKQAILKFIASNFQEIEQNQSSFLIPCSYIMEVASNFHKKLKVIEQAE